MDSKSVPAQFRSAVVAVVVMIVVASVVPFKARAQAVSLDPWKMPRIGNVDERFVSYNIEMAEVTGGNFWRPYHNQSSAAAGATQPAQSASTPAGMNPNMYQYRRPIDLANPLLRKVASALGPAYIRVSGTWANSVYFADSDSPPAKAPDGFSGVLMRKEWKGVIDFVQAVNGKLVTSFATSVGTRNEQGAWTPKRANDWLAYAKSIGGQIAAAEFMNEPTYAAIGGAPKDYNAGEYARDIALFGPWLKKNTPDTIFLGLITFYWFPIINRLSSPVLVFDAAGLALFAVAGAGKALAFQAGPAAATLLGMLTGIGGGMVRDILVMEIPNVLRTELYAVAALIGAAVMVLGKMLHLPTSVAATTGAILCFGLRFTAMRRGWQLPIARPPQKSG